MKTLSNFLKHSICFILLFSIASCESKKKNESRQAIKKTMVGKTIIIQPYSDLTKSQADFIIQEIKKVCPHTTINPPTPLPSSAYHSTYRRYRADSLIIIQKRLAKSNTTLLGITSKDISTTKGTKADWGIMGLGFCPGSSCVVSTYRLRGSNKLDKFRKVTLHELAHTEGLPHCPDPHCYMRDAKGKDYLNEEIDFCMKCKKVLKGKGWKV